MSKLALLRTTIKSNFAVRTDIGASLSHGFFSRASPRSFSTESELPRRSPDSAVDSILRTQSTGSVFVRLQGSCITKNTLKTDIVNMLEGCNLTPSDVKVEYARNYNDYNPMAVMVHFSSSQGFNQANKMIARKGRLCQMERIGKSQWDIVAPYDGKTVLIQGLPATAIVPDLERFLSCCDYDDPSLQIFFRPGLAGKTAMVRFRSQTQAMNCFIRKNKNFCLNTQVLVRVLQ